MLTSCVYRPLLESLRYMFSALIPLLGSFVISFSP